MVTFLNVGPPRSGTHSFRNMCANHPQIDIGKLKEPAFDLDNYFNNWSLNGFDAVLDSTPTFEFIHTDIENFLGSRFSKFKKVFLMIDSKKFYASKLFHNYISLQYQKIDPTFNMNSSHNGNTLLKTSFNIYEAQEWLKSIDLCSSERFDKTQLCHLEQSINVFGKDNIIVIQTNRFNMFRKQIFNFLELEYYPSIEFPSSYRTVDRILSLPYIESGQKIKLMRLYNMTNERVNSDKDLDIKVKSDLDKIRNLGLLTYS